MQEHKVVSRQDWLESRREHLTREKELTRLRDRVSQERRELPWVGVDQEYDFERTSFSFEISFALAVVIVMGAKVK